MKDATGKKLPTPDTTAKIQAIPLTEGWAQAGAVKPNITTNLVRPNPPQGSEGAPSQGKSGGKQE